MLHKGFEMKKFCLKYFSKSFESMRAEVALLRRKVGWLGCGWINIPTFGAL